MELKDIRVGRSRPEFDPRRVARLLLLLLFLAGGLFFVLSPLSSLLVHSRYELHEGDVTPQNIRAPKRMQYVSALDTKAERERAANSIQEVYSFDPTVAPQQRNKLATTLQAIGSARTAAGMTVDNKKSTIRRSLDFEATDAQLSLFLSMDDTQWQALTTNTPRVLYEVLSERVTTERLSNLRRELPDRLTALPGQQERALAVELVISLARVNYAPDPAKTALLRKEAQDAVVPVSKTVEKNEIILREGDVVRATDLEKLEAVGLRTPAVDWYSLAAAMLMVGITLSLLVGYIWVFQPSLLNHERRLLLVALVMLATVVAFKIIVPGRPYWGYIFPMAAVAMLLATLLEAQLALLVTVLLAFLSANIASNSLELAGIGLVAAVLGPLMVQRSERILSYFMAGGMVAVGSFAVIAAFRLMTKEDDWLSPLNLLTLASLAAVNGLLSSALTVGFFSLLGRVFGITTTMQLLELSDPTQPLLRRLLNEAPGTYHHSIMVGNLAERAAEKVGADALLVRVGSYYHDIGKLARPYFFIENQFDGRNVHDTLDPQTSARIVSTHVKDGLEMAERYRLPARVREFISEHHGTRLVSYFYNRATQEGSGQLDPSQFQYPGPQPRSKEAGIVMLADSVEAVVRSAKDHSAENVAALVRKVVDERMSEGQLDECELTIHDVKEIKKAFTEILMGMYHPRIEYPPALPAPKPESRPAKGQAPPAAQAAQRDAT